MISFLIIDDHPLFREALGNAVRLAHPDARILEAMSIKGALNILASEQDIDLALLDLFLPDATGFSGFLRLRETCPRLPVAIVSSEEDQRVLSGSISVPKNFVVKNEKNGADVTQAVRARLRELTPQQLRVLDLVRRGLQNKQIAVELKLAESTVKAHVTEILRKLKLFSRNKAVIEIGKINFTVPKPDPTKHDRAKPT